MATGAAPNEVTTRGERRPWWETRPFVAALILLSAVPLLYPPVPPLVDLLGHMGRYRVQLDLGTSPWLGDYYGFHWAAIGNLGVDLLVMPLAPLVGLEAAVKLIVLCIPPMTVAGLLWVAREVHHRIPPTALFALPFAYSHPFMFGFANFALSVALAFLAFGLWLHLAQRGRLKLRAILFVPISLVVFFAHTFGWGMLGLLCFSAEAVRQHDSGRGWLRSGVDAALHASVMALPIFITIAWRSEAHGGMTRGWFEWDYKWQWLKMVLRDRWEEFDLASASVIGGLLMAALVLRRLTFSRNLLFTALVLLVCFIIMPRTVFGSTYADMRLLPYVLATAVLAIRFRGDTYLPLARLLALGGLLFFAARLVAHTVSLKIAADDQSAKLQSLDQVPMGARVASLVLDNCGRSWPLPRNSHLGALVIVRRHGFSNDQWVTEGMNLLGLRYTAAGPYRSDPSQMIRGPLCPRHYYRSLDRALETLPRDKFDYLWLIDLPPLPSDRHAGLSLVWRSRGSELYEIN